MSPELTTDQVREIARLRRRFRDAELRVHERPWGVIVEVRRGRWTIALERFEWSGATYLDRPIMLAA
jgi:hypothetical protein